MPRFPSDVLYINGGRVAAVSSTRRWKVPESPARLAQSAERKALNLVVVGSSPTVGDCAADTVMLAVWIQWRWDPTSPTKPAPWCQSTCGLVAMTSASHAEGRQLNPGQVYI